MSAAAAHRYRSATNIPHFLCTFSPTMTSSCANFILPFFFSPNKEYFETYIRPPFLKEGGIYPPPQTHSLFPFVSSLFFYYFYLTLDIYIYTTESANVLSFNGPGSALTEWSAFDFFYCSHIYSPFSLFFRGRKGFSRHGNQMGKNTFNTNVPMKDRLRANKRRTRQFHFSSFLFLSVGFSHFNFLR